ncbi:MAG: hypothetical protein QQN63_04090 [Nitrosopumilus sp.]
MSSKVKYATIGEWVGVVVACLGIVGFILCLGIGIALSDIYILIKLGILSVFSFVVGAILFALSQD